MWVKICGVTTVADALGCVDAGADAIGVNFVPTSPRVVTEECARQIAEAVAGRAEVIGVVASLAPGGLLALRQRVNLTALQLHGDEAPDTLAALLPRAYKALRIATAHDVTEAARYAGTRLLVDAKVKGALGGTGETFDWSLVHDLALVRPIVLAGGLTANNVAQAIRAVRPWGVDTASGVERANAPRAKDLDAVRAFIDGARAAD